MEQNKFLEISSPSQNIQNHQKRDLLSTPKTNKSITNSKSPLGILKLKKSKRRECTPAYSPKNYDDIQESQYYHTEKKSREFPRLNFDLVEMDNNNNLANNRLSFGNLNPQVINEVCSKTEPKKKFLSLIEESLNEVSDNYFGVLGSQTTPDTIFKSVFLEESNIRKENPEKREINSTEKSSQQVFITIENILNQIKQKYLEILFKMRTQIIYFDANLSCFELSIQDLAACLIDFDYDINQCSIAQQSPDITSLFIPANFTISSLNHKPNSRFIFEVDGNGDVRLGFIEIHLY